MSDRDEVELFEVKVDLQSPSTSSKASPSAPSEDATATPSQNGASLQNNPDPSPASPDLPPPYTSEDPAQDHRCQGAATCVEACSAGCLGAIESTQTSLETWYTTNKQVFWQVVYGILLFLWTAYFVWVMVHNFSGGWDPKNEPAIRLIAINAIALFCVCYWALRKKKGQAMSAAVKPYYKKASAWYNRNESLVIFMGVILLVTCILLVLVVDVGLNRPQNLQSALGILTYLVLFFIFSANPSKVRWRPVVFGLVLQFILAYFILRSCVGFTMFQWMGDRVQEFLVYSDAGAAFVFGEGFGEHFFAFSVLPVVIFFSTVISMLYYLGWMQIIIYKVAWVMQIAMGTTAGESLNAAGNIFVGQTEAPLMIRPIIKNLTRSEMHAIMTGGFATIAGSVLATYIKLGIPSSHLLSASVMSAPAALAMSKLFYPETEESRTTATEVKKMEKSPHRNLIDAASAGASDSIALVANIAANLIAFLALLEFLNQTLLFFGGLVGIPLTFQLICSYVLYPFAWVMGAQPEDCRQLATLIGVKTFTNEYIAYGDLDRYIENRVAINDWVETHGNGSIQFNADKNCWNLLNVTEAYEPVGDCLQQISERAGIIAVYALCGFANLSSIGIMLGGLGVMAPERKQMMSEIVFRAMIAGNVACFMTACIAGLLTPEEGLNCPDYR